jgi:hypothetical protein
MSDLPNSWDEKREGEGLQHWMFTHELLELLQQLEPDDWLTPNTVGNLMIGRGDINSIGIINFHNTDIEFWYDGEEND